MCFDWCHVRTNYLQEIDTEQIIKDYYVQLGSAATSSGEFNDIAVRNRCHSKIWHLARKVKIAMGASSDEAKLAAKEFSKTKMEYWDSLVATSVKHAKAAEEETDDSDDSEEDEEEEEEDEMKDDEEEEEGDVEGAVTGDAKGDAKGDAEEEEDEEEDTDADDGSEDGVEDTAKGERIGEVIE